MRDHPPSPEQIALAEAEDADALASRKPARPRRRADFWFGWCLAVIAAWVAAACFLI